ncbi:MAG: KEOPS complex subunit Pcc1 [Candidatus Caldarchaeum sp.]|nr:KEOPS complex subunit Pcc1 [Candidatus Caldarchaeum sp.]
MAEVELKFLVCLPENVANVVTKSIMPEISSMISSRSKLHAELVRSGELMVTVRSIDLVAARAAANTVIRLLNTSLQTMEVLENVG